jgi:hypothetical protein
MYLRSIHWQRPRFQLIERDISFVHTMYSARIDDSLPSSSLASWLVLIAVGRVGGGGVFDLTMVREADDELNDWIKLRMPSI